MLHFYTLLLLKNFFSNLFWKNQWRIKKKKKMKYSSFVPIMNYFKDERFWLIVISFDCHIAKCHLEKGIGMAFKWHTLYIFTFLHITTFTPCLPMLQKGLEGKIRLGFVLFEQKLNFPNDILWLLEIKCLYWEIF